MCEPEAFAPAMPGRGGGGGAPGPRDIGGAGGGGGAPNIGGGGGATGGGGGGGPGTAGASDRRGDFRPPTSYITHQLNINCSLHTHTVLLTALSHIQYNMYMLFLNFLRFCQPEFQRHYSRHSSVYFLSSIRT